MLGLTALLAAGILRRRLGEGERAEPLYLSALERANTFSWQQYAA